MQPSKGNHKEAGNEYLNPDSAPGEEVLLCGCGEGGQDLVHDCNTSQDLQQMLSAAGAMLAQVCGTCL